MTEPAAQPPVLLDVADGVATVTLNRPDQLNALVPELGEQLIRTLTTLQDADDVRVVVLTGAGRGFCAGGDLSAGLGAMVGPPPLQDQYARLRAHTGVSELLRDLPQVTIAAVNGPCAGAGLSFALCCDVRVAAASAKFAAAFLGAGVSGDFGGIWLASRLLGSARAQELFLLGERLDAPEALRVGLVAKVLPDEGFRDAVAVLAQGLAAAAPLALAGLTANLRDAESLDFAAYLDAETRRQAVTVTSDDALEAAAAFLGKRAPSFHGR